MSFRFLLLIILTGTISGHSIAGACAGMPENSIIIRKDYNRFFEQCDVSGGIVLFDYKSKTWITNDSSHVHKEFLPASSFKIINLLIALETGVIKDENEVLTFPGKVDTALYGYRPDIYYDMSLAKTRPFNFLSISSVSTTHFKHS